jgi:hypothetical protein
MGNCVLVIRAALCQSASTDVIDDVNASHCSRVWHARQKG